MRALVLTTASLIALAACQPETQPASEAAAIAPTPEEMGQDDPSVPFTPAPVASPRTYDAYSKTAMSFTPGSLVLTETPQASSNLPAGAIFAFTNGYTLKATLMPGGAQQGGNPVDFSKIFVDLTGAPIDVAKVVMYQVDEETVPETGASNGGFCKKTSYLATYTVRSPGAEDMTIAAFDGDTWPPAKETALCGTFTYGFVQ